MNYLSHLEKRGITARIVDGSLRLSPREKVTDKVRDVVREKKEDIIAELKASHRQAMIDQAESFETRILAALESDRIDQAQAEDQLTYIYRLTATSVAVQGPCDCGEVLLHKQPADPLSLPLLCYRCHVPVFGAEYFLASEAAAAAPVGATDDLSHSRQWL